ncbi:serine/threonine-protein kinase [Micromonospora rifamycinica]|uniref:non-specific serine/threonine protein kinase n=2 Tax=Micromonospora rifamycinica TaxID=291594 RepID=A0A1C5KEZ9_9ACTN|nr:serine/threonine-protein kinase [Micromonospora rifamycinica]SCG81308.1 Serine/threonine protein kinase [Micromonospora rifamycinica]
MQQVVIAGRYRLLKMVGRGGMGRVWLARDEVLHREVAIKEVVPPAWLADDERDELRLRTLREARTAARLNHPNVVRVYDVVQVEERPWIVMEYVLSQSLQTVLDTTGPVDPVRAADIGMALLAALRAAHSAGVLHRDVKPQNVLVADDGRVMLTDFGLATFDGGDGLMTRPGMVLGSPQFVAPERAAEGVSSVEADLWSLGATLHAAVEGRSPYARSTAMATLAALATSPPDPAPHAGPLRPVLDGLLLRDPRQRIGHDEAGRRLEMVTRPVPTVEPPTVVLPVARSASTPPPHWPGRDSEKADRPTARSPQGRAESDAERDWGPPGRRVLPDPADRPATSPAPVSSGAAGPAPASSAAPSTASASSGSASPAPASSGATGPERVGRAGVVGTPPGGLPAVPTGTAGPALGGSGGPMSGDSGGPTPGSSSGIGGPPPGGSGTGGSGAGADDPAGYRPGLVDPQGRAPGAGSPADPGSGGQRASGPGRAGAGAGSRRATGTGGVATMTARLAGGARGWLLAGVTLAVGATVGIGTTIAISDDDHRAAPPATDAPTTGKPSTRPYGPPGPGTGSGRPGAPPPGGPAAAPPPMPCLRPDPVGTKVTGRPATVDDGFRPPPGWTWYDGAGYRIAVPVGWLRTQEGTVDCFRDPGSRRTLSVEPLAGDAGGSAALDRLRDEERAQLGFGSLPGYDKIKLAASGDGAQWECRWDTPFGGREHGLRLIPGGDLAGYLLSWSAADEDWNASSDELAVVRESFRGRSTEVTSPT